MKKKYHEKVKVFTQLLEHTCKISEEESQNFCQGTERMVKIELNKNLNKVTTKWVINIQSIRDP